MPRVSLKATINQQLLAAGDVLSGKIWINPTSSGLGRTSGTVPVVTAIVVTALCRAKVEWQDPDGMQRGGEAYVYRLEKQLLQANLTVTGPKIIDFKLTLPLAAQRTSTSWAPSSRFEHAAGHEIPPTLNGVIEHLLIVEARLGATGLLRQPRQLLLELPYVFVKARDEKEPDPLMEPESRQVRQQRRPQLNSVRSFMGYYGPGLGSEGEQADTDHASSQVEYLVSALLPGRVHIGGELPIEISVRARPTPATNTVQEVVLSTITINLISMSACRVKIAENTGQQDPERGTESKTRHRLYHQDGLAIHFAESVRIDKLLPGLKTLAPARVPTFRTYNAARAYRLELWISLIINKERFDLAFGRDIHIESQHYRQLPPQLVQESGRMETSALEPTSTDEAIDESVDEVWLPLYSGPSPPAYDSHANHRLSLTTQALREGVDIIDLI